MTSVAEAASAKGQLAADIAKGVNTLSLDQTITFVRYVKLVLPLDGFVFWVKAELLSQSALFNVGRFGAFKGAQHQAVVSQSPTLSIKGSLHYSTDREQDEDTTYGSNTVVFTALSPVQDFNETSPNALWLATFGPDAIRFAFSSRGSFYQQADTYHYVGVAVTPTMETQIIDDPAQFNARQLVVSNSLPMWLALNNYVTNYDGFRNPVQLYPSFALPDNLAPPYGAVHINPEGTLGLQSAPFLGPSLSHAQLCQDDVRVTIYGLNNQAAMDFVDCVNQYTLDTDNFGLMGIPVARDEKKTQVEMAVLAMKKTIQFTISYNQSAARNVARQLIESCFVNYQFSGTPTQ